jgi:hypothetical protein
VSADESAAPDEGPETGAPNGADRLEKAIVAASVLLVAATLGYVAWQAAVTPEEGVPRATVERVEPMPDSDRQRVTVELDNRRGVGLATTTVVVRCGDTERTLAFEHVPAGGGRTGTVVCPADTDPRAIVGTWVEA